MKNLVDSHCHLQFLPSSCIPESLLTLSHLICNSTSQSDWQQVLSLSSPQITSCIGLHPWYLLSATPDWEEQMRELIHLPNIHVGEIGIDNYKAKTIPKVLQDTFFTKQLLIAKEFNKVANIHCVSAFGRLIKILKQVDPKGEIKILLHSWEGPWDCTESILKAYGNNVVFSMSMVSLARDKGRKVAERLPCENIVIETDSPSQSVLEFVENEPGIEIENGKVINKPWYLKTVFKRLGELKMIDEAELSEVLMNNYLRFFG